MYVLYVNQQTRNTIKLYGDVYSVIKELPRGHKKAKHFRKHTIKKHNRKHHIYIQ